MMPGSVSWRISCLSAALGPFLPLELFLRRSMPVVAPIAETGRSGWVAHQNLADRRKGRNMQVVLPKLLCQLPLQFRQPQSRYFPTRHRQLQACAGHALAQVGSLALEPLGVDLQPAIV